MRTKKQITAFLMALIMLIGTIVPTFAAETDWTRDDFIYYSEDTNRIKGFSEQGLEKAQTATTLTIPEGVTAVGRSVNLSGNFGFGGTTGNRNATFIRYQAENAKLGLKTPNYVSDSFFSNYPTIADEQYTLNLGNFPNIKTLILPEGLTVVGPAAFSNSSLESVEFPTSLRYIDKNAFYGTHLTNVNLSNVDNAYIQDNAFARIQELDEVNLSGVVGIGEWAFSKTIDNSSIPTFENYDLTVPNSKLILGNKLESIGAGAFAYSNYSIDELSSSLKFIGDGAFNSNRITKSLQLPNKTFISQNAFLSNGIQEVIENENVLLVGSFNRNQITKVDTTKAAQINDTAYYNQLYVGNEVNPNLELFKGINDVSLVDHKTIIENLQTRYPSNPYWAKQQAKNIDEDLQYMVFEANDDTVSSNIRGTYYIPYSLIVEEIYVGQDYDISDNLPNFSLVDMTNEHAGETINGEEIQVIDTSVPGEYTAIGFIDNGNSTVGPFAVKVIVNELPIEVETRTEEIPYTIEYIEDDTLEAGIEKIQQQGQPGEMTITENVTYLDGVETSRTVVSEVVTKEPVTHIVKVGSLIIEEKEEKRTEEIDFEEEIIYDNTLLRGEEKLEEGQKGEVTITEKVIYHNGQEVSREEVSREITKEPIKQIRTIGTMTVRTTQEIKTEVIPFEVEILEDENLEQGQEIIDVIGVNGERTIIEEVTFVNDEETERKLISDTITTEPIKEVKRVGTMVIEVIEEVRTEKIPFEIEIIEDNTLPEGEEIIDVVGIDGENTIIEKVIYTNGLETDREVLSKTTTKEVVNEVKRVGTMVVEVKEESRIDEEELVIEFIQDPSVKAGDTVIKQEGQTQQWKIYEKVIYHNGEEVERTFIREEKIRDGSPRIIQVGVGVVQTKEEVETIELEYETEIIYDDTLEKGKEIIDQKGEVGIREIKYTISYLLDQELSKVKDSDEVIKEPVKEIKRIGTLAIEVREEQIIEILPIVIERIEDDTLEEGQTEVVEGQTGEKVTTVKVTYHNGVEISREVISEDITKEPKSQIVKVGTKHTEPTVEDKDTETPVTEEPTTEDSKTEEAITEKPQTEDKPIVIERNNDGTLKNTDNPHTGDAGIAIFVVLLVGGAVALIVISKKKAKKDDIL